ncbi:MAG: NAD-dependent epimerase/dehydratase family protein [Planctomycetales bacterium]|nr:NAD-dependent epimerase/dehydratase family protein [Planctomycetales bacterium]
MTIDYLVTGATGLVGNNLVRVLLEKQCTVRILARETSSRRPLQGLDVEWVIGDVTDKDAVQRAVTGVNCVLHAAADTHIGWRGLNRQRLINVQGTTFVAHAALTQGIRVVQISSVDALPIAKSPQEVIDEEATGEPKSKCTYVVTKRQSEAEVFRLLDKGLDAVIVNPGFMLGPWDWKPSSGRMLLSIAKHPSPVAPTGGMSGCDVRDVATAIVSAAERGVRGRRYILAGENITYLDAWQRMARQVGARPPRWRMGPLVRIIAGYGGDLWGYVSGGEPEVNSALIEMSQQFHYYDSSRAKRELDYQTRSFDTSIRDAWEWLKREHYV